MQQISARQLAEWRDECASPDGVVRTKPFLLDVREPWEYEICHLAGAQLMPMHTVPLRLAELDADADTVVVCHHGARSMQVAVFLERNGFTSIFNLAGVLMRGHAMSIRP